MPRHDYFPNTVFQEKRNFIEFESGDFPERIRSYEDIDYFSMENSSIPPPCPYLMESTLVGYNIFVE